MIFFQTLKIYYENTWSFILPTKKRQAFLKKKKKKVFEWIFIMADTTASRTKEHVHK